MQRMVLTCTPAQQVENSTTKTPADQRPSQSRKSFRTKPYKFASNLFKSQQQNNSPTFSAETAEQYFQNTYQDLNHDHRYVPLPEFQRPHLPEQLFSLRCPTRNELCKSVRKKMNCRCPRNKCFDLCSIQKMPINFKISVRSWAEDLEVQRYPFELGSCFYYSTVKI